MRSKVEERTRACLSDVELKSESQSPASESSNTGATRLPSCTGRDRVAVRRAADPLSLAPRHMLIWWSLTACQRGRAPLLGPRSMKPACTCLQNCLTHVLDGRDCGSTVRLQA